MRDEAQQVVALTEVQISLAFHLVNAWCLKNDMNPLTSPSEEEMEIGRSLGRLLRDARKVEVTL